MGEVNFEDHTGLVLDTIKKMFKGIDNARDIANQRSMDVEDLIQVGMIGLWKSTKSFDESKGFKFSTYGVKAIRNAVLREINRKHNVKMPQAMDNKQKDELSRTVSIHQQINDEEDSTIENMIKDKCDFENEFITEYDTNIILGQFKERDRAIVKLRIEGQSFSKIANQIGVTENCAGKAFQKVIKKLQTEFDYKEYARVL